MKRAGISLCSGLFLQYVCFFLHYIVCLCEEVVVSFLCFVLFILCSLLFSFFFFSFSFVLFLILLLCLLSFLQLRRFPILLLLFLLPVPFLLICVYSFHCNYFSSVQRIAKKRNKKVYIERVRIASVWAAGFESRIRNTSSRHNLTSKPDGDKFWKKSVFVFLLINVLW